MKEWWQNLAEREQQLITALGLVFVIFLLWQLLWLPQVAKQKRLQEDLMIQQQTLNWMQPVVTKIVNAKAQGGPVQQTTDSLLSSLEVDIKNSPVANNLSQFMSAPNNGVKLSFQQVAFDDFIAWLLSAHKKYGANVERINVTRLEQPGIVQLDVELQ